MFIDDLTNYLTDWMASHRNIIICGDFNIYIDDLTDIEAQIFNDTMSTSKLIMLVTPFDLLFTEITSQLTMRTFKGRYISYHRAMVTEFGI